MVLVPTASVLVLSIAIQSIFSSVDSMFRGGMIEVINALLSLSKASLLNPSDIKDNCPKLELEFVIEASEPLLALKCFAYPMANTETI